MNPHDNNPPPLKTPARRGTPTATLVLLALPAVLMAALVWSLQHKEPASSADKPLANAPQAPHHRSPPASKPVIDLAESAGPLPQPPGDPTANMVLIPAGEFLYGEENVPLDLPAFYIDRYEVSQAEYAAFLRYVRTTADHEHCDPREPPQKDHTPLDWGRPDLSDPSYPVVGLDYWDVLAYAGWVGKRLPTEQEWEKAARGTDGREYPWGDTWDERRCNWGPSPGNPRTLLPVDSMPDGQSPFGCFHMLGNAAEWTASFIDEPRGIHCGRGYCWRIGHLVPYRATYRMPGRANLRDEGSGIRCALDAPTPRGVTPSHGRQTLGTSL